MDHKWLSDKFDSLTTRMYISIGAAAVAVLGALVGGFLYLNTSVGGLSTQVATLNANVGTLSTSVSKLGDSVNALSQRVSYDEGAAHKH